MHQEDTPRMFEEECLGQFDPVEPPEIEIPVAVYDPIHSVHISAALHQFGPEQAVLFVTTDSDLSLDMNDNRVLYAVSLCTTVSLAALALRWEYNRSRSSYPPGLRGCPLIGSIFDIPRGVPILKGFGLLVQKYSKCSAPAIGHLTRDVII